MRRKFFTAIFFLVACIEIVFAWDYQNVVIGSLHYNLDISSQTAEVTSNYPQLTGSITIPAQVTYNDTTYNVTTIGNYAFSSSPNLTSVVIPNTVTSINSYAFSWCFGLISITIPESVTNIGAFAFNECASIQSLSLPSGTATIGDGAFKECTSLKNVILPTSLTTIPEGMLAFCSNLQTIIIPENVESIGSAAFKGCSKLSSISIPQSVHVIEDGAFKNCTSLPVINNIRYADTYLVEVVDKSLSNYSIEPQTRWIAENAFENCINLISIILPDNILSIGTGAFKNCNSLISIVLPSGIKSIGDCTFCSCKNLASFSLPDGITNIGDSAFYECESLDSVLIPINVITLGNSVFCKCENLVSVNLSESITEIGYSAFMDCRNLLSIVIPNNVKKIGNGIFRNCTNISSVILGDSVKYVSKSAFWECNNLDTIALPKNLQGIHDWAFLNCKNLKSITIPDSVTYISNDAFDGCSALSTVIWNARRYADNNSSFKNCPVSSFIIGDSVEHIPGYLCKNLSGICSVVIPKNIKEIGNKAFDNCSNLREVIWNAENAQDIDSDWRQYFTNSPITSIYFGDSVKHIPAYICRNLDSLTYVRIPKSLSSIGKYAFEGCINLSRIEITDIAAWCDIRFAGATANPLNYAHHLYVHDNEISNLVIPDSVYRIRPYAFLGGWGLITVSIPTHVNSLGAYAFKDCSNLVSTNIPDSISILSSGVFSGCKSLQSIHIPSTITEIGDGAFGRCESLTSISIPSSVTKLRGASFAQCRCLTSVNIPNSVSEIGDHAFQLCTSLQSINFPDSLTSIQLGTLSGCSALMTVKMPRYLTELGQAAFSNCSSLTTIDIPSTVTQIGVYVFAECVNLKSMNCLGEAPATLYPYAFDRISDSCRIYVPCGTLEAYQLSAWNAYHLQYAPSEYKLQAQVKEDMGGHLQIESNKCVSSITATPDYGYYFDKWADGNTDNPRIFTLTQDTIITAIFAAHIFTITFVDDNDTILSEQEVEYNAMPIPPADPIKTNNAQYSYTFAGWSPTIVAAIADATYKAIYNRTTNQYTITFLNDDSSILSSQLWDYGVTPTCEQPTKEDDEEYTYTFSGWTPEIVEVVADATYTATYTAKKKSEGLTDTSDEAYKPMKCIENGHVFIKMPDGSKCTILGESIK